MSLAIDPPLAEWPIIHDRPSPSQRQVIYKAPPTDIDDDGDDTSDDEEQIEEQDRRPWLCDGESFVWRCGADAALVAAWSITGPSITSSPPALSL